MSAKNCTTHSYACDCREAKFKELVKEAYNFMSLTWDLIDDDVVVPDKMNDVYEKFRCLKNELFKGK